jgi:hypothetical protein
MEEHVLFPQRPITHEHIRQFCAKFNEGIRVEYKSTLSQSVRNALPKLLSSFANSHGGVLIVGVDANNGVPQAPFDGFPDPNEELPLTVESICLQNLNPPLLPKSTVVQSDAAGKIFLIVEIEESSEAPHAIENSRKVYVRTGNASNPYELATVDLIIDLVKRRDESLERANLLLGLATERAGHTVADSTTHVQVSVCPTYPRVALCASQEVWKFANDPDALREHFLAHNHIRRIPDGLASPVRQEGSHIQGQYREVSRYGLLFARDQFVRLPSNLVRDTPYILDPGTLFQALSQSLVCARRLYGLTGYSGNLRIQTTLQNVRNEVMFLIPNTMSTSNPDDHRCITGRVYSEQLSSAEEIKNSWRDVLCRTLTEIGWSFWQSYEDFPPALLEQYFRAATQRFG